jgi:hypothetical protein
VNAAFAARVRQLQAEAEHRRAIREFRAQRAADEQARTGALLNELIAALAGLADDGACVTCISCRRALSARRRTCLYCGTVTVAEQARRAA